MNLSPLHPRVISDIILFPHPQETLKSQGLLLSTWSYFLLVICHLKFETHFCSVNSLTPRSAYVRLLIFFYHMIPLITPLIINNFVILQPLVLFLVFLLSCFCHPLHCSTNVPKVPSAHITFRCHASMLVLTENSWRQVLWEIALVDALDHALSTFCQSSTKGLG